MMRVYCERCGRLNAIIGPNKGKCNNCDVTSKADDAPSLDDRVTAQGKQLLEIEGLLAVHKGWLDEDRNRAHRQDKRLDQMGEQLEMLQTAFRDGAYTEIVHQHCDEYEQRLTKLEAQLAAHDMALLEIGRVLRDNQPPIPEECASCSTVGCESSHTETWTCPRCGTVHVAWDATCSCSPPTVTVTSLAGDPATETLRQQFVGTMRKGAK